MATQLQNILVARQVAKDNIALSQPVADFVDSDIGKNTITKLRQKLGEVRKIEKYMDERYYKKRYSDETHKNPEMDTNLEKLIKDWKKSSKK